MMPSFCDPVEGSRHTAEGLGWGRAGADTSSAPVVFHPLCWMAETCFGWSLKQSRVVDTPIPISQM